MSQLTRRIGYGPLAVSPIQICFALGITLAAVYLLHARFGGVDFDYIALCIGQIGLVQWVAAAALTALSFYSLGKYDVIWHRVLGTNVMSRRAHRSGMAAIAIGQSAGFCAVTAGLTRWRGLPEQPIGPVAKVSAAVAMSFMTCWAILAIPALWYLADQTSFKLPNPIVVLILILAIGGSAARIAQRNGVAIGAAFSLLWWTACDVAAAAGALYVILPAGFDVSFATLLACFVVALGAAIISSAPAGIGVFDVVLISVLAAPEVEPLLAALLAFRIVYYLIPFIIGCLVIVRPSDPVPSRQLSPVPRAVLDGFLQYQAPASWALVRQNGQIMRGRNLHFFLARAPFCTVSLGDPLRARRDVFGHHQFLDYARQNGRLAVIYQASGRLAAHARKDGWHVLPIARRAHLCPQTWTQSGSSKQGLRRKLAQASKAGVEIHQVDPTSVTTKLTEIARVWSIAQGGQMGFSMGTYSPGYVANQAVFMISIRGENVGFITFNKGHRSWALDLIRYTKALPQGAIHAAVAAAIEAAKVDAATTFCLAAAPYDRGWQAKLCQSRAGLVQFKQSFRPEWQTLYACAPNFISMWVSAFAVTWAIQKPLHKALVWCAYGRQTQR